MQFIHRTLYNRMSVFVKYTGDKGKDQIHMTRFMRYNPSKNILIVDWDKKTVNIKRK